MTKCYTYDMDKMRNIRGGLIKTVFTAVLAVIVVFTAVPFSLNADNRFVADPTGRRDGYAAYLYDNTTGLPTSEANAIAETSDGKGYPQGLKGDEIPRVAQIIGVADAFDAMYSTRSYRKRMNFEKVVSIIKEASGTQFAEDVVEAFLRIVDQGGFKAPDDDGGGTMEDINNIHKRLAKEANEKEVAEAKKIEENKDIDPENRKGNEGE